MKRFAASIAVVCLMLLGFSFQASATTLTAANPITISGFFTPSDTNDHAFVDVYKFTLNAPATVKVSFTFAGDIGGSVDLLSKTTGVLGFATYTPTVLVTTVAGLTKTVFTYAGLAASSALTYFVNVTGIYNTFGIYSGKIEIAAAPIPPALLMFVTALGGLGFAGYRRWKLSV